MRALTLVGVVAMLAIAACGGGPAGSPLPSVPGGGGAATAGPTGNAPTDPVTSPIINTDAPEPVALPDPCVLITQEEAALAVAAPVSAGVEEGVGTPDLGIGRSCRFDGTGEGAARIETFENVGDLWETYKLQQSQFGPVSDLPGAGEEAFTVGNYQCNVVKGDFMFVLTVSPGDRYATDPEPRMIALCLAASARF